MVAQSRYSSLQSSHSTSTALLQSELEALRHEHQKLKVQFRDLELGNDDLERSERAMTTSLADAEARYTRTLEEKVLLEQELHAKASLEEECQRLRDELRGMETVKLDNEADDRYAQDASVELSVLKNRITSFKYKEKISDPHLSSMSPSLQPLGYLTESHIQSKLSTSSLALANLHLMNSGSGKSLATLSVQPSSLSESTCPALSPFPEHFDAEAAITSKAPIQRICS